MLPSFSDSGDSCITSRAYSRIRVTSSNSSEMRHVVAYAVRGTRTRMDSGAKVEMKEGRKRERVACISHVATHTWNAVCKCVQSDGGILQPVVPPRARARALIPALFCPHPRPLFLTHLGPPTSRGFTPGRITHTYKHIRTHIPFFGGSLLEAFRVAQPRRPPPPVRHGSVDRSVRRSPDIISLEAQGSEESRVYGV